MATSENASSALFGGVLGFNGLAEQPSAATGTAMRERTLRDYAAEPVYSAVEVLPIENNFWRFYRLTP